MLVNKVCRNCLLKIQDCDFLADLMSLLFYEFDVILGMDWLTLHDAVVNCKWRQIVLKYRNGELIGLNQIVVSILLVSFML